MLREDENHLEVCMLVRHQAIAFAPGALVFPGGKVDAQDVDESLLSHLDGAAADARMRGFQIAAIRETFEECGILFARGEGEDDLIGAKRLSLLASYREALHGGKLALREFLEKEKLRLACDQLVHFAHWVTPESGPRRFDTHFYLARAPAGHTAVHDGIESTESMWVRPAEVLDGATNGKYRVMFPTSSNLGRLCMSVDECIALASTNKVVRVMPWIEQREDGGTYLCIPPQAGYPVNEIKYRS